MNRGASATGDAPTESPRDSHRRDPSAGVDGDVRSRGRRPVSRYDLLLAAIPLLFLVAAVAGAALSVPPRAALTTAAIAAAVVVCDGLFRNPPPAGAS